MEDIRAQMKKYMVEYRKAGLRFLQTGNGAKGETKDTGSKEFESAQDSEVKDTIKDKEDETRHVESTSNEVPVSNDVVETVSDSCEDEATAAPPVKKAKKSSGAVTFVQDFKSILDEPVDTTIYSEVLEKKQEMAKMKMKVQQLTIDNLFDFKHYTLNTADIIKQGLTDKKIRNKSMKHKMREDDNHEEASLPPKRKLTPIWSNADQLKLIGVKVNQLNSKFQLSIDGLDRDIPELHKGTLKIENAVAGDTFLKRTESYHYTNSNERGTKMIYVHIMDQIINNPILFHRSSLNQFSEMSFLVKFWGPIIELFFNPTEYFIQWGDTNSPYLSIINFHFKLDCKLKIKDFNSDELDVTTGELARHSSTTSSKMSSDFTKSALNTKAHLNAALKRMPYCRIWVRFT
ncbi:uncharacterized protein EV154DRAFT_564283 [Mucor mucedo]|uniref:uncharacterized protein n=1 Tax=Mucor mucedo TaxID=29922 RepID=UPI00221E6BFA|nr:uncharacterized protein EV154DRAFT_564283 [Mucor mucedo]KAI7890525.1 hypothetical protein EV154DRAFT_564283 [Mucor mucedo]